MKYISKACLRPVVTILFAVAVVPTKSGCSGGKTRFGGVSSKLGVPETPKQNAPELPTDEGASSQQSTARLALANDFQSSLVRREFWTVTWIGEVTRFRGKVGATDEFEAIGNWKLAVGGQAVNSGHRTYVTEIGLLIGKTGGYLYRIGDDTPSGSTVEPLWTAPDPKIDSRVCATSFMFEGVAYIGAAYTSGDEHLRFVKIPIDKNAPNRLNLAQGKVLQGPAGDWGYSCFIDQSRSLFWSAYVGGVIYGFDLAREQFIGTANAAAPNKFSTTGLASLPLNFANAASYAISGDSAGDIISSAGRYTHTYDPISKMVFTSDRSDKILVTREDCFNSKKQNCADNVDHFSLSAGSSGVAFGPLSSLNDGSVIAIARSSKAAFLLRLNNPSNPAEGMIAKKVADLSGDAYMYTDFTGATLYAATVEKSYDLSTVAGYIKDKIMKRLMLKWTADSGQAEAWVGLNLELRCYHNSDTKPPYARVNAVPVANTEFAVDIAGCVGTNANALDIKISPDSSNGNYFVRTKSIQVLTDY